MVLTHSEVLGFTAHSLKIWGVGGIVIRSLLRLLYQKACQSRMSPKRVLICQSAFQRAPTYFSNYLGC